MKFMLNLLKKAITKENKRKTTRTIKDKFNIGY